MKIKFFTAGGTIDKIYFDKKNDYHVGEPQIETLLKLANVTFEYEITSLLKKDSLDFTDEDRQLLYSAVANDSHERIVITHGTDGMVKTAQFLKKIPNKIIALTGSAHPALFRDTDASFNVGCAITAVQTLPSGVYIAMNGQIFDPEKCRKNVERSCFEVI